MYGSNFTDRPIQSNHIFGIVKEPCWANAEPTLLLPFSAQSYVNIILLIYNSIKKKPDLSPRINSGVFSTIFCK